MGETPMRVKWIGSMMTDYARKRNTKRGGKHVEVAISNPAYSPDKREPEGSRRSQADAATLIGCDNRI
jgi:hypothetical protein